jgi:hypothetical protein
MAKPEDIREAIDALPLEEGDREKLYENIDRLAALIEELAPIEYLKLPRVQDEIRRIMEYAHERQAFLNKCSLMRKWVGRMLPFYGAGLGALAASIPWSLEDMDSTYLERLAGQPSGQLIITFIFIAVLLSHFRKQVDEASQRDIDSKVLAALVDVLKG